MFVNHVIIRENQTIFYLQLSPALEHLILLYSRLFVSPGSHFLQALFLINQSNNHLTPKYNHIIK